MEKCFLKWKPEVFGRYCLVVPFVGSASCPTKVAKRGLSPTYTISAPHTHRALYFATRYCPGGSESVLKLPQRQTGSRNLSTKTGTKKAFTRIRLGIMAHCGELDKELVLGALIQSCESADYASSEEKLNTLKILYWMVRYSNAFH